MRLYQSTNDPTRWYAYSQTGGWVTFEDTTGVWSKPQPLIPTLQWLAAKCLSNLGSMQASLTRMIQHGWRRLAVSDRSESHGGA